MTDHPNRFAIGQKILYRPKADKGTDWQAGTVLGAEAAREDGRRETPRSGDTRYVQGSEHQGECGLICYEIAPEGTRYDSDRLKLVCDCTYELTDADGSGRWRDDTQITTRSQLQLLYRDLGGDVEIDSGGSPLEETDIIRLGKGDASAEVDVRDVLRWARGEED